MGQNCKHLVNSILYTHSNLFLFVLPTLFIISAILFHCCTVVTKDWRVISYSCSLLFSSTSSMLNVFTSVVAVLICFWRVSTFLQENMNIHTCMMCLIRLLYMDLFLTVILGQFKISYLSCVPCLDLRPVLFHHALVVLPHFLQSL